MPSDTGFQFILHILSISSYIEKEEKENSEPQIKIAAEAVKLQSYLLFKFINIIMSSEDFIDEIEVIQ